MCKELEINRTSTRAYEPQGNAMIERTNRTIEGGLMWVKAKTFNQQKTREGEKFPNRSAGSTSENVTQRRYQTRSASGMTIPWQLKEYFFIQG